MKPRNHIILALIKSNKKFGPHEKTKKAIRQQEKIKLKKELDNSSKCVDCLK